MKPLKERIDIEQYFANGGKIRNRVTRLHSWVDIETKDIDGFVFDWRHFDYEKAPRTFTLAGKEYPAALTEAPSEGERVWISYTGGEVTSVEFSLISRFMRNALNNGSVFATKEDAEASIEAIAKLRRGEL